MDFLWITFAFTCGYVFRLMSLPPLIGYLLAGFILHFMGVEPLESLETFANMGITLMLFTIGLKLNVKDLLKTEVWASTLSHMGIWTLLFGSFFLLLASMSLPYFADIDFTSAGILAFALSFSSTVCIVKILEESGEMKTRHGQLAIGVLVMQDIVAVLFLVIATGKIPSIWALGLFVFGILLSQHAKASELSKSLLSFKDLFLIGFFLSIGFTALPDWSMLLMALILSVVIPLKYILFFFIFSKLHLRGRTSYLCAMALSNFSEFGLIVAALCVDSGWLDKEWLVILALAVSISFIMTSVIYRSAHSVYSQKKKRIKQFESPTPLPVDLFQQPNDSEILVIGLGRVGKGAFQALHNLAGDQVWGMDADRSRIQRLQKKGMHVFYGDGEDADLWENMETAHLKLVLLALPSIDDCTNITQQLRSAGYHGDIAAIARYPDEQSALLEAGISRVFNFYAEAGVGFAEESMQLVKDKL